MLTARDLLDDSALNASLPLDEPLPIESPTLRQAKEMADSHSLLTEASLLQFSTVVPRHRLHSSLNSLVESLAASPSPHNVEALTGSDAFPSDPHKFDEAQAKNLLMQQSHTQNFIACVSVLSHAQHKRYKAALMKYFSSGGKDIPPKTTAREEQLPALESVIDFVEKEQNRANTGYRVRQRAEAMKCSFCEFSKHHKVDFSEHLCTNHNHLTDEVRDFAMEVLHARRRRGDALVLTGSNEKGELPDEVAVVIAVDSTSTIAVDSVEVEPPTMVAGAPFHDPQIPPTRQLCLERLNSLRDEAVRSALTDPLLGPLRLSKEFLGSQASPRIIIARSALTALCTAHFSSATAQFFLPLRVVRDNSSAARTILRILISKPLIVDKNRCLSRRAINTTALKRLVFCDRRFYNETVSFTDCFNRVVLSDVRSRESFSELPLLVRSRVAVNSEGETISFVKLEYTTKAYNTSPDVSTAFQYELFSKRELAAMLIASQCHPQAMLRVIRVNVYTNAVIGIEWLSAVSLREIVGQFTPEIEAMWSVAARILRRVADACSTPGSFVLVKTSTEWSVDIISASQLKFDGPCSIEPPSEAACRRECLEPCVWRHPDRVPFTFAPIDDPSITNLVINRTRSVFSAEEMRQNDVYTNCSSVVKVHREDFVE